MIKVFLEWLGRLGFLLYVLTLHGQLPIWIGLIGGIFVLGWTFLPYLDLTNKKQEDGD